MTTDSSDEKNKFNINQLIALGLVIIVTHFVSMGLVFLGLFTHHALTAGSIDVFSFIYIVASLIMIVIHLLSILGITKNEVRGAVFAMFYFTFATLGFIGGMYKFSLASTEYSLHFLLLCLPVTLVMTYLLYQEEKK